MTRQTNTGYVIKLEYTAFCNHLAKGHQIPQVKGHKLFTSKETAAMGIGNDQHLWQRGTLYKFYKTRKYPKQPCMNI